MTEMHKRSDSRIQTIRSRLLVTTVLLVLAVAAAVGTSSAVFAVQDARTRTLAQMEAIVALKEDAVLTWIDDIHMALGTVLSESYHRTNVRVVLLEVAGMNVDQAKAFVEARLISEVERTGRFEELMVINLDGIVMLSTSNGRVHEDWSARPLFERGQEGRYVETPEYDPLSDEMSVFFSQPVQDGLGYLVGVIVGRTSLDRLNAITSGATGLGESGEAYVLSEQRNPLAHLGKPTDSVALTGSLAQAATSPDQRVGSGRYDDYQGTPVFGAYRWIEDLQVALVAQQDAAEVTAGAQRTVLVDIAVALGAVLVAALGSVFLAQSISSPLSNLADTATQIASGNLELSVAVQRQDEVGALAQSFNSMTEQLRTLVAGLEQRIAERTEALEASAEVSHATTSLLDPEVLTRQVVDLVRDRFDLYYVGLFLLDEEGRFAVLRAGTGEAGQEMLSRGHRLGVGSDSMIGQCISRDAARIALDVGAEAVRFENPLLPDTRSELALPMRSRGRVIGAMTVQSTEASAFDAAYISVLQAMADQIAVAVDNARLYAEADATLSALETAQRRYVSQAWAEYLREQTVAGYRDTGAGIQPIGQEVLPEAQRAMNQDGLVIGDDASLSAPIVDRGQAIGALGFAHVGDDQSRPWNEDELAILEAVRTQFAQMADNLRLLDQTQRGQAREQAIGQVATRMRESLELENVLQAAAEEMRETLGLERVVVRLGKSQSDVETSGGGQ